MSGSTDHRNIEVVDTADTLLAILVYPDGQVRLRSSGQPLEWVAETLQRLTDSVKARLPDASGEADPEMQAHVQSKGQCGEFLADQNALCALPQGHGGMHGVHR